MNKDSISFYLLFQRGENVQASSLRDLGFSVKVVQSRTKYVKNSHKDNSNSSEIHPRHSDPPLPDQCTHRFQTTASIFQTSLLTHFTFSSFLATATTAFTDSKRPQYPSFLHSSFFSTPNTTTTSNTLHPSSPDTLSHLFGFLPFLTDTTATTKAFSKIHNSYIF